MAGHPPTMMPVAQPSKSTVTGLHPPNVEVGTLTTDHLDNRSLALGARRRPRASNVGDLGCTCTQTH
jgi:hypothetical protein